MTVGRIARALAAAGALALPAPAAAATQPVNIQFQDFGPNRLDVLPGETVDWANVSERVHTVTADDASFDSGDVGPGEHFTRIFDSVGTFAYHCTKHAGMVGEIDVEPVTLGPLPAAAVPSGAPVEFEGRSADPGQPVRIERSTGAGFTTVATVMPGLDGTWQTTVTAADSADYRAADDAGASRARRLIVSDRKVLIRAIRRGVAVSVTPALPYGRIQLQEFLRERFGWWPVRTTRLDYVSSATFEVPPHTRVRVVLVDKDGWTPLAISAIKVIR